MRGRHLFVEHAFSIVTAEEEIAVDAHEVAVDPFFAYDLLDAVDRRAVALDDATRTLVAVHVLEDVNAIVHCVRQVRRRST